MVILPGYCVAGTVGNKLLSLGGGTAEAPKKLQVNMHIDMHEDMGTGTCTDMFTDMCTDMCMCM